MPRRWHSTGSPTFTVADERFGSFMVHCKRVPAGRTRSRALAVRVIVRLNRNAETVASRKRDFILHLSRLPRNGAASWGHALVPGKSNHGYRSRVNKEWAAGEYVGQTANERARLRALCRRKLRTQPR